MTLVAVKLSVLLNNPKKDNTPELLYRKLTVTDSAVP
jgi:hypothetical protein